MDGLKNHCCKHIVDNMSKNNISDVMEFAQKYDFTDFMKNHCVPYVREMFTDFQEKYYNSRCYEDEPDYAIVSTILMGLNDAWFELLISDVSFHTIFDFHHDSWKNPGNTLICNRLSAIFSNKNWEIHKFYGCIDAEIIHQFPKISSQALELCLSVTDPHHAKKVIEAINEKRRFKEDRIAIHIRSEEFWPRNWSALIPIERDYRPSVLLLSDADDDKIQWVVKAAKAFLPQSDGSYNTVFEYDGRYIYDEEGVRIYC